MVVRSRTSNGVLVYARTIARTRGCTYQYGNLRSSYFRSVKAPPQDHYFPKQLISFLVQLYQLRQRQNHAMLPPSSSQLSLFSPFCCLSNFFHWLLIAISLSEIKTLFVAKVLLNPVLLFSGHRQKTDLCSDSLINVIAGYVLIPHKTYRVDITPLFCGSLCVFCTKPICANRRRVT